MNPAARVNEVVKKIRGIAETTGAIEGWASIFAIEQTNKNDRHIAIVNRLGLLLGELSLIQLRMGESGFSPDLYSKHLARIENALSPGRLHSNWGNIAGQISPEVLVSIAYCAEILASDEAPIDPEKLGELSHLLDDLGKLAQEEDLPASLKLVIGKHLASLNEALAMYPLVGAESLKEATRKAVGDLVEVRDEIEENKSSPAVKKLGEAWDKANRMADGALKAEKLFLLGSRVTKFLSDIF